MTPPPPPPPPPADEVLARQFPNPLKRTGTSVAADRAYSTLAVGAAALAVIFVGYLIWQTVAQTGEVWSTFGVWGFLTGTKWVPTPATGPALFGALPFIYGTLMTSLLALLLAVPAAIGIALALAGAGASALASTLGAAALGAALALAGAFLTTFLAAFLGVALAFCRGGWGDGAGGVGGVGGGGGGAGARVRAQPAHAPTPPFPRALTVDFFTADGFLADLGVAWAGKRWVGGEKGVGG